MRRRLAPSLLAVGMASAVVMTMSTPTSAVGPRPEPPSGGFQGEDRAEKHADRDHREGQVAPTARQRVLATQAGDRVRFNRLGTPAVIAAGEDALSTDLPADPVRAARAYVMDNLNLLGIDAATARALEVVAVNPIGEGAAVLLRQRFGDLAAGVDGMLVVGVRDGAAHFASSSLSGATRAPVPATLSAEDALAAAARDAGVDAGTIRTGRTVPQSAGGWTELSAAGLTGPQWVRLVAVPTADGVRAAHEVVLLADADAEPVAFTSFVDARTGEVLVRESLVDHADDNPRWSVFPDAPPVDYSSTDTRVTWCFFSGLAGCDEVVGTPSSPLAWDVDPATGTSTNTTLGNNARTVHNWFSNNAFTVGVEPATPSPAREYTYPWTNQWNEERCNPDTTFTSGERNDIDAARANLFVMHNRMHDWSYHLGFTETAWNLQTDNFGMGGLENDPEQGNAQAGGVSGGPPGYQARDNANQITPPDGVAPITNMYLWQPIPGGFYAPCVDGDFDMSVIGHEYGHAISNRMVAGPASGLSGFQARAMGESWSDLVAMEYLNSHGYAPDGISAYAVGEYVTSDGVAGIRNYNMSDSPLNYSNVAYDIVGQQVHADGEIWSAINFDIREAMDARYGAGDAALLKSCANGETPVDECPGSRRWVQLVFDAWLLMAQGTVSMVDARDAMLAADMIRFGGANQDLLWNTFAARGLGEDAASAGTADPDPTPDFTSPYADEATLSFKTVGNGAESTDARLFVGDYQARSSAVADNNPGTALDDTVQMVPGTYELLVQAPGFGHTRTELTVRPGQVRDFPVNLRRNHASSAGGATASGDGIRLGDLIDDDEATTWQFSGGEVASRQVTVALAGGKQQVRRVQVSALLEPGQNRFTALRQFRLLACEDKGAVDCLDDGDFNEVFTSADDAFPAIAPRPRAPELSLRSFAVPRTKATHLRVEVVTNQCTGAPDYAGDQDDDPRHVTDCAEGSAQDESVRIAEVQAFSQ